MDAHNEQTTTILATGADTLGAFGLAMYTLPPYSLGPTLHRHTGHIEGCFVIEGVLALTHDEETLMLRNGEFQVLRPGEHHTCWNPSATPTRLLLIYAPGANEEELQRLASGEDESGSGPWDTS